MDFFPLIHVISVCTAYMSFFMLLTRRIGRSGHKNWGKLYAVSMICVAFSGLGIYNFGGPSMFHVLACLTLLSVGSGLHSIRQFRITGDRGFLRKHFSSMVGSFMGLVIASLMQSMRVFSYESYTEFFTVMGLVLIISIIVGTKIMNGPVQRRVSHWWTDQKPAATVGEPTKMTPAE